MLIITHGIFKVICPVCTTADFLFNSHQHYAGLGDVADIMVICLLTFPETSYVCCYLAKQIPAHHVYTEREKMKTKSNGICSLFQQPSLENDWPSRMAQFWVTQHNPSGRVVLVHVPYRPALLLLQAAGTVSWLGMPFSPPTSFCIQIFQTADLQRMWVPNAPPDTSLSGTLSCPTWTWLVTSM